MMSATLNTRAPAPVDVTKRQNTGKTEIKKKRIAGAFVRVFCLFVCVCVCVCVHEVEEEEEQKKGMKKE